MKKTITTTFALTLVAAIGFAQDKPAAAPKPAAGAAATTAAPAPAQADPVIIAAGNIAIRQSEFESALETLPAEYQQYAAGPGKRQFAEDYLRMKMLAAEGVKNGLDKDAEVLRQLALMRENLIAQAQLERIEKGITVPEADLRKQYDEQKGQYEQVKARHILIAFKGSPAAQPDRPELTEEQAKEKAENIRKQLLAGASFDELAKKESDDVGSGARGGDLGEFGRGQMVPEFEKAAFEAKVGDLTPVVRTQFGYHVIKVEQHGSTPFEEVRANLERTAKQTRMQATLDQMKTNAKPTFNEAYFGAAPAQPKAQPASHDGHGH